MKKFFLLTAFIFLFTACNNSGNNNKTGKTKADSLMEEVMEGHNAGMARMSRINEAQKKIQQGIDSISKLPAPLQKNSAAYKMKLDSILGGLKYADYAMNRWMEEFNMDSSLNNEGQRVKYLESEKIKISKVKDAMINSLKKADSLLNK
jgi:hypothetical protein